MTQHTQGEWKVRIIEELTAGQSADFVVENEAGQCIVASSEGICSLADARLIAAAPKLLEALEYCAARFGTWHHGQGGLEGMISADVKSFLETADAAIAAAREAKP